MEEPVYKVVKVSHYQDTYSGQKETKEECMSKLEKAVGEYILKGYVPHGEVQESKEVLKYSDVTKWFTTFSQTVFKPLDKQS